MAKFNSTRFWRLLYRIGFTRRYLRPIEAVEILNCDSVGWLERYSGNKFDLVFIDPARRGDAGQRVFNIHHCQPDISELLPLLSLKARFAMVKLSPMLDVTQTLRDLPFSAELHVIDDGGECRELLAVLDFERDCHMEAAIVVHSAHMELHYYSDNQECECRSARAAQAMVV